MKEVNIEIEQIELRELGVEQPDQYARLRFNESAFIGYWITVNAETKEEKIIFYVGNQTFLCKKTLYNIELFDSILKHENSSSNNHLQST